MISAGRFHISEEVWTESTAVDAPLKEWCGDSTTDRSVAVYATTQSVARLVGQIAADYPRWSAQGGKNGADPFVIAIAEHEGWQVISGEVNGGPANPKIPYVCRQRGVAHGRFIDLIRTEDWVMG